MTKNVNMSKFAELILQARKDLHLKLVDVADIIGVDKALLSKFEKGTRKATREQVDTFIHFYKLDEKTALSYWLSDKVIYDLSGEAYAREALIVAEERIKYELLTPEDFEPDKTLKKMLAEADKLHKMWSKKRPLNQMQLQKMREYFNLNYTYESNKIEGNTLTLHETFLVVNQGLTIGGKSVNEHLEAINHAEAVDFLVDLINRKEPFNQRVLKEIHYLILKGIDKAHAGVYRKVPVYISGTSFVPPQPYMINKMMEDIFAFYQMNEHKLHPIILAADMHEKIVTVHPFIDGNGRTCRLIMNLILLAHGYTLAVLKGDAKSRLQYYNSLEAAQVSNNRSAYYKLVVQTCIDSLKKHIEMAG